MQVQFATRLCLLLDTLHRHKRNHGNLSPHHIVADLEHTPMLFTLVDMSCSRHFHGVPAALTCCLDACGFRELEYECGTNGGCCSLRSYFQSIAVYSVVASVAWSEP